MNDAAFKEEMRSRSAFKIFQSLLSGSERERVHGPVFFPTLATALVHGKNMLTRRLCYQWYNIAKVFLDFVFFSIKRRVFLDLTNYTYSDAAFFCRK
jgi:hypothetical protein